MTRFPFKLHTKNLMPLLTALILNGCVTNAQDEKKRNYPNEDISYLRTNTKKLFTIKSYSDDNNFGDVIIETKGFIKDTTIELTDLYIPTVKFIVDANNDGFEELYLSARRVKDEPAILIILLTEFDKYVKLVEIDAKEDLIKKQPNLYNGYLKLDEFSVGRNCIKHSYLKYNESLKPIESVTNEYKLIMNNTWMLQKL